MERVEYDNVIGADIARQIAQLERDSPGTRAVIIQHVDVGALCDIFSAYDDGPPLRVLFVYAPIREGVVRRRRAQ
jgi:hypothetical protein